MALTATGLLFIISIILLRAYFARQEKKYQKLRKELFFDEQGNFLLEGKEIRFPM